MKIYVYRDDQVDGPFDDLVVQQALANGTMRPEQLCCRDGSENWVAASSLFHTPPPPPPPLKPPLKPPSVEFFYRTFASRLPKITATRLPQSVKIGLIALGGFVGLIVFVCILGAFSQPTQTAPGQQASGVRVETVLAADLQTMLSKDKQKVFEHFHSLGGTAGSDQLAVDWRKARVMISDAFKDDGSSLSAWWGGAFTEERTRGIRGAKSQELGLPAHIYPLAQGAA